LSQRLSSFIALALACAPSVPACHPTSPLINFGADYRACLELCGEQSLTFTAGSEGSTCFCGEAVEI
jgi:hypothetical protein